MTTRAEVRASARACNFFSQSGAAKAPVSAIDFMKSKTSKTLRHFRLRLPTYGGKYFIKRALKLEAALARRPKLLHIEMIGDGEIPADTALLFRSILLSRAPGTRIVTEARSSLQGGSVLVWLLGDRRLIRDDARVFFKRNPLADEDPVEVYAGLGLAEAKYKDSYSCVDPEDADYACVLEHIGEFLPVGEFAGRVISVAVLRQFGLVDNEQVDGFLATVFAKTEHSTNGQPLAPR
jgi:hypothetical protein